MRTSFWIPFYVEQHFYGGGMAPGPVHRRHDRQGRESACIIGWSAAFSAAAGVILGGYLSDLWRQRDPRGRLFINMLSVALPIPLVAFLLTTDDLAAFYWVNPFAHMFASAWVGAAVATLQDLVLPRMRATAGATYILGTTMVGLALGPYYRRQDVGADRQPADRHRRALSDAAAHPARPVARLTPSRRALEASKVERARAAGEPV